MRRIRAAIQGELGAFSQEAAQQLLGPGARVLAYQRFEQVFEAVARREAEAAVIPIENTLHGSVHENYDHLLAYDLKIVGETNVRIVHNLIASPGVRLKDVRRVYSHPVALNQCLNFLAMHPVIEQVPFYDTAGSVKMVTSAKLPDAAAIASSVAAEIYGGVILRRSIEDDPQNFTRFFLLSTGRQLLSAKKNSSPWKTSLVFSTRNQPGALFRSLSVFALRDISLTKIESRPLRGKPWEYRFYLDLAGSEKDEAVRNAIGHLSEFADFVRVLGSYPRGN